MSPLTFFTGRGRGARGRGAPGRGARGRGALVPSHPAV